MASVLESHPKRAEVDALLMEGLSSRKIIAQLGLQYAHSVVTDYRRRVFLPNVRTALMLQQRNMSSGHSDNQTEALAATTKQVSAAGPITNALRERDKARLTDMDSARAKDQWSAVSAFDRNGLADLRTLAEMTGALQPQQQHGPSVTVNVLVAPGGAVQSAAPPSPISPMSVDAEVIEQDSDDEV